MQLFYHPKENNKKRALFGIIGNSMMLFSFFALFLLYIPIIKLYTFPSNTNAEIIDSSFSIEIPKIKVTSKIIENVDPFNEEEYKKELIKGIAHAKGTSLPEDRGTIFIFAHSSDSPWNIIRYNAEFFRLGELERGDEIKIRRNGKLYTYKVSDKRIVWPTETKYLTETKPEQLILQTCTPIGTSLMRLLVFAKPV